MVENESEGKLIFMNNLEPLLQKESFRRFEDNASLKGRVYAEVIQLASLQREAVIQFFWEDLSLDEISKNMGLSRKSVEKILGLALTNLKAQLTNAKGI